MEVFIRMAIYSPALSETPDAAAVVTWAERAVERGANSLLLRHPDAAWIEAVLPALQGVRSPEIHVGVNTNWIGFKKKLKTYDFLHLKSNYMDEHKEGDLFDLVEQLQELDKYVESACHTEDDIDMADYYGLNLVVVSPVFPTASHPEQPTLGLAGFAALATFAQQFGLPVIALGGVQHKDEDALIAAGASGWAGISAFA
jgi:thiamine monophosphate synthase